MVTKPAGGDLLLQLHGRSAIVLLLLHILLGFVVRSTAWDRRVSKLPRRIDQPLQRQRQHQAIQKKLGCVGDCADRSDPSEVQRKDFQEVGAPASTASVASDVMIVAQETK